MIKAEYLTLDPSVSFSSDVDEKTLLLLRGSAVSPFYVLEKIKPKKLKSIDIKQAVDTMYDATVSDPAMLYVRNAPGARSKWLQRKNEKIQMALSARLWIRQKLPLTVDHGRSIVVGVPAPVDRKKRRSDERLGKLANILFTAMNHVALSTEQRRRREELISAMESASSTLLGASRSEMRVLASLATHPSYQGRGYATALIDALIERADSEGRSTWLFSSNPDNDAFYESFGFFRLGEAVVGENNPTWNGEPLRMALMVRVFGDSVV